MAKKAITWVAVCVISAAATLYALKGMNERFHWREMLGITRAPAAPVP